SLGGRSRPFGVGLEVLEPKPTSRPPNFESTMTSSLLFPYSHRHASPTKMGCIASKTTSQDKPFLPIVAPPRISSDCNKQNKATNVYTRSRMQE
ncbi:mCG145468, partial [Mus musculus]